MPHGGFSDLNSGKKSSLQPSFRSASVVGMITFPCPSCASPLVVDPALAGQACQCPTCTKVITVPRPAIPIASPVIDVPSAPIQPDLPALQQPSVPTVQRPAAATPPAIKIAGTLGRVAVGGLSLAGKGVKAILLKTRPVTRNNDFEAEDRPQRKRRTSDRDFRPVIKQTVVVNANSGASSSSEANAIAVAGSGYNNSLATAALLLAIASIVFAFVPSLAFLAIPTAALALLLSILGALISIFHWGAGVGSALLAGILSIASLVVASRGLAQASAKVPAVPAGQLTPSTVPAEPSGPLVDQSEPMSPPTDATADELPRGVDDPPAEPPAAEPAAPERNLRTWTSAAGHKTEAEFVSLIGDKVKLRKANGAEILVPVEKLSAEDQEFIAKRREEVLRRRRN